MGSRRKKMKADARGLMDNHFRFYLLLFLPIFILMLATGFAQFVDTTNAPALQYLDLLSLLSSLLMIGVSFVLIDLQRGVTDYSSPVSKSFTVFNKGSYFLGTIALAILIFIFTFLWSLLLFVPGIIKGLAYSQAYYIYRDHIDQGNPIGFLEAITQSRQLMDGHKWEYFVLQLSFIGWAIACVVIIPILWVLPYQHQTFANFYVQLLADQANAQDGGNDEGPVVVNPGNSQAPAASQAAAPSSEASSAPSSSDQPTETFRPDSSTPNDSNKR
ncbi:DUF975 family protein [Lactobacillus sp. CRM56-3]|uniref:DUF975 family protein n=2 Tax=Secundilactobacillus folii TaxID=2678357 RepID=A0A7X3C4D5_9LACO|nr:DUF975 family protein [Secundilactobacillus folii]